MRTFLFFIWDDEIWFVETDNLNTLYGPYLNLDYAIDGLDNLLCTGYEDFWFSSQPVQVFDFIQS